MGRLTLDDELKSNLEWLTTYTFKEEDTSEISPIEFCPFSDLCRTVCDFNQELPNFDKAVQCDDTNSTIDITMGNISFLNASLFVSNDKDSCRNLLTIDDPSNLPQLKFVQQNLDVKSIARCIDLNNKKMFELYAEKKFKRKALRLNHYLSATDDRSKNGF